MDMETIRSKLQKGSYSSCSLSFLRDLLLLCNNAIVFFPKDSLETSTARQLRRFVSNEIKNQIQPQHYLPTISDSLLPNTTHTKLETSDSLPSKQNSCGPILVCRKRSSILSKASSPSLGQKGDQQSDDKKPALDAKPSIKLSGNAEELSTLNTKPKEKPITGVRSLRRTNKKVTNNATPNEKFSSNSTSDNRSGTSKSDKIKAEAPSLDKKRSAADFLKRIKKNSAAEALKSGGGGSGSNKGRGVSNGKEQKKTMGSGSKGDKGRERVLRNSSAAARHGNENSSPSKRGVGRPPKKTAEPNTKRGREGGGKEVAASKRPKKRSRR